MVGECPPCVVPDAKVQKERLTECALALVDVFVGFGFKSDNYSVKPTVDFWFKCLSSDCNWMSLMKWLTNGFFAYWVNYVFDDFIDDQPPVPVPTGMMNTFTPIAVLGGKAYRYFNLFWKISSPMERMEFLNSIKYIKKGFPRPDEKISAKSLLKTFKALTTRRTIPTVSWVHINESEYPLDVNLDCSVSSLINECQLTTFELLRDKDGGYKSMKYEDFISPYMTSFSSSYNNTRSMLGTFGHLMQLGLINDHSEIPIDVVRSDENNEYKESSIPTIQLDTEPLKKLFQNLWFRALKLATTEESVAVLVALQEALKVRVISKGPPLIYFILKPVQKFVWGILKEHPTLKLIGQPIDALSPLLNKFLKLKGDERYLSVDYEAATDNIHPELSRAVVEALCGTLNLPKALAPLMLKAMTDHKMQLPQGNTFLDELLAQEVDKKELMERTDQEWGQLMGSIVSFVVLCIINLSIMRQAYCIDKKRNFPLHRVPVLVNGDDALIKIGIIGKTAWENLALMAGLKPSVGKVFYSKQFFNINSTDFLKVGEKLEKVKYINLGLMYGVSRSGVSTSVLDAIGTTDYKGSVSSLSSKFGMLIDMAPVKLESYVRKKFINKHYEKLKASRLPWYVPACYGGIGLRPQFHLVGDSDDIDSLKIVYDEGPSEIDRKIVRAMVNNWFPSKDSGKLHTLKDISLLNIHEAAMTLLPKLSKEFIMAADDTGSSATQNFFKYLYLYVLYFMPSKVVSPYFTENITTGKYSVDNAMIEQQQYVALNANRKMWDYYYKHQHLFSRLTPFDFLLERRQRLVGNFMIV